MTKPPTIRRERAGRARVWSAADVAALLSVPAELVTWHCERAAAMGRASLFFGAFQEGGEWCIPDRVARRVATDWPLQHYTVDDVAGLLRFEPRTIRRKLLVLPAHEPLARVPAGRLGARLFFSDGGTGGNVRIPASEVARLAAGGCNNRLLTP